MPPGLTPSLRVALRYVTNFFRRAPPFQPEQISTSNPEPLSCPLPTRYDIGVRYYRDLLQHQIMNAGISRNTLERHQVVRITQYQDDRFLTLQREFLVAEVRQPTGDLRYLRIRRSSAHDSMTSEPMDLPNNAHEDQNLVLKALNDDLKSMYSDQGEGDTLRHKLWPSSKRSENFTSSMAFIGDNSFTNMIEESPLGRSKDDICLLDVSQLDLSWKRVDVVEPSCLYLYQLASVAFIVQSRDFIYAPFTNQSFWYAAMIMATIRQIDFKDAWPPKVVRSHASPGLAPSTPEARSTKVYVPHASIPHSQKSSSKKTTHRRKVMRMPITKSYPVMVEQLCSSIEAELKTMSEMIEAVERKKVALTQQNEEAERARAEIARLQKRIDQADEENLALVRELESLKQSGRSE